VIDLHTHTTASDGRDAPDALVCAAARVGIRILAVTDHDTMASWAAADAAGRAEGIRMVPGIEITAIHHGRDVHVLGYFLDPADGDLLAFLDAQRQDRRRRLHEMVERLAALGIVVDEARLLASTGGDAAKAVGRPLVAAALVRAGHAADMADAFDKFLLPGRPAFVPRRGGSPADVVALIARAGGLSSLAHPAKTRIDAEVPALASAGLSALEVCHPDHTPADEARYRALAKEFGLLVTGGSDYHGAASAHTHGFGRTALPDEDFARFEARAGRTRPGPTAT
jgi:predicted metal-dependent phosphoesterase TrpH